MLPAVSACGAIYGAILGEFAGQYLSRHGTLTAWEALRRSVDMPFESWIGTAWLGGIVGLVIRMATWPRSRRRLVIILVFLATLLPAGCYSWVVSSLD